MTQNRKPRRRTAIETLSGNSSALDAIRLHGTALDLLSGSGFAEAMKLNSTGPAGITANPGFAQAMKLNSTALAGITASPGFAKAMKLNTEALAGITASPGFAKAMKLNTEALAGISGISAVADAMKANVKALTHITESPGFLQAIKLNTRPLADVLGASQFASMIATPTMPRHEWTRALAEMQGAIGAGVVEAATAEFELAAEVAAQPDGEEWWFARLPVVVQFGLLLMVLQVLDKAGEFLGDLTGQDVPPAYRTGVEMLFCLAFALLALIEAKADSGDEDDASD